MNTQAQPPNISLSAELARPSNDVRRRSAMRWYAALHSLCVIRATLNETSYEAEWERIFDAEALQADLRRSKWLCLAALDVLEIQHEVASTFCRMERIPYFEEEQAQEYCELLAALRYKIENDLP